MHEPFFHCRGVVLRPETIDEEARTVEAVLATDRPCMSVDSRTGKGVHEVWRMDGCDMPASVPLVDNHNRGSVRNVVGTVANIRRTPTGELHGTLHISQAEDGVWSKIREGHIRDVSGGIAPDEFENLRSGESKMIRGQLHTAPRDRDLRVVTRWRLREVSLTPFGADPEAKIRAENRDVRVKDNRGEIRRSDEWQTRLNLRVADYLRWICRSLGGQHAEVLRGDDGAVVRHGFSSPQISNTINTEVGSRVLAGYSEVKDTTAGLTTEVPSETFLESQLGTLEGTARLHRLPKGRPAPHVDFAVWPTPRTVVRYAAQLVADEQSFIDSATTMGAWLEGAAELGRAARRTYLDLVWATLLKNPTCYDGVAMFHSSHGNKLTGGGSALSDTSLATACQDVQKQILSDKNGKPIHLGLTPKYLIVAPALGDTARKSVRNYMLDGDAANLEVRVESRIGPDGVLDPIDDATVVTGSDTLWLLAAPAAQRPAVVISYLAGSSTAPVVNAFKLEQPGLWGSGWSVKLDIGCHVIDWRSWVQSVGA